jgi:hypothetical protein
VIDDQNQKRERGVVVVVWRSRQHRNPKPAIIHCLLFS